MNRTVIRERTRCPLAGIWAILHRNFFKEKGKDPSLLKKIQLSYFYTWQWHMTQLFFLQSIQWHKISVKEYPLSQKNPPCHLAAMLAGHGNCPELPCKSLERSGAVPEAFLYLLNDKQVQTPSDPAYKFVANWLTAQHGSSPQSLPEDAVHLQIVIFIIIPTISQSTDKCSYIGVLDQLWPSQLVVLREAQKYSITVFRNTTH